MADPEVKVESVVEAKAAAAAPAAALAVEPVVEAKPEPEPKVEAKVEPTAAPAPAAPVKKDWREERIAKLTAQLNEEREKNVKAPAAPVEAKPGETPADFEARVKNEARRLAAEETFNLKADAVATAARETYGAAEFNARLTNIQSTINQRDPIEVSAYVRLVQTAMDTDEPGKVIFLLGEDPSRAADIMAMSPTKMALEIAKLAIAETPGVSKVAKPLTLVEANNQADRVEIDPSDPSRSDKLSTAEWMKRRLAQHKVLFAR
jgi:hypothetical protein